jgi:sugar phosphate isomerase/epimerase
MTPAWVDDLGRDLPRVAARGFTHVALEARVERPVSDLEALADAGVVVAAVRLHGDLTLADVEARREQLRLLQRQVADAALLGAAEAWLEPVAAGTDEARAALEEGLALLAEYAHRRQVRLVKEGQAKIVSLS